VEGGPPGPPVANRIARARALLRGLDAEVRMEVRDGFIIGVFNYCDRWCEACAFTSWCSVFADGVEADAALDPALKEVVEAPPLIQDLPPPPPKWVDELIEEMNEATRRPLSDEARRRLRRGMRREHRPIEARARAYCRQVHDWLRARELYSRTDPGDPCAVIGWFHSLIPAKIHRALCGLADDDPAYRDWPADFDGSAKVALLGIERSHASWLELVDRGVATTAEVTPFVADLVWLADALDRVFPNARAFVRPAFDEAEEVAKLLAAEAGG
jgi:hypothetical protein